MMHWGRPAGLGLLACTLVLGGCSSDSQTDQPTAEATETSETTQATTSVTTSAAPGAPAPAATGKGLPVSAVEQGLRTAAAAVPNGRPFDLEVDSDNGRKVLDIEVASDGNEFEVRIDQAGAEIISQRQVGTPSDDVAKAEAAQVDANRAMQTAVEREPDATVSEIQIDTERGVVVWQIELVRPDGSEVEIDVDAQTGAITDS